MHPLSPKSLLQKKQPSKKVVTHSKVQERFCKNGKQDATWNQAASMLHLPWSQPMCTAIETQVEGQKNAERRNTKKSTWSHLRLQQLLLPTTSLSVYCPKLTSFWLFSPPVILNMLGIRKKKELNLCQRQKP